MKTQRLTWPNGRNQTITESFALEALVAGAIKVQNDYPGIVTYVVVTDGEPVTDRPETAREKRNRKAREARAATRARRASLKSIEGVI